MFETTPPTFDELAELDALTAIPTDELVTLTGRVLKRLRQDLHERAHHCLGYIEDVIDSGKPCDEREALIATARSHMGELHARARVVNHTLDARTWAHEVAHELRAELTRLGVPGGGEAASYLLEVDAGANELVRIDHALGWGEHHEDDPWTTPFLVEREQMKREAGADWQHVEDAYATAFATILERTNAYLEEHSRAV